MKKTVIAVFATVIAALSLGAGAAGVEKVDMKVPVEMVVPATITQVVVTDGENTFVMATEQKVEDMVTVTPEMAKTAQIVTLVDGKLPKITSVSQAANNGKSVASATPFGKTGLMEPIATTKTVVNTVYYKVNGQTYSFETTDVVGDTVTVTQELLDISTKV